MYRLQVFGPFKVSDSQGREVKFPAKSVGLLLAYLALQRNLKAQRSTIASVLWPDSDPTVARTNLRTAIHRARKTLPGVEVFIEEDGLLGLDPQSVTTDTSVAQAQHQRHLFCSDPSEALTALRSEWDIVHQELLEGWDDEWIVQERTYREIRAVEQGCELARMLDEAEQPNEALTVLRALLKKAPHRVDALEHALQLEFRATGPQRALELAADASGRLASEIGVDLPTSIKKIVRAIKNGVYEPAPRAGVFRSRNELVLLARMFEANLQSNSQEALRLLATESLKPMAWQHPTTTFAIMRRALEQTSGASPERIELVVRALPFASYACEYEEGHRLAAFALEHVSEEDPIIGSLLSFDGFMHFEQRNYGLAREVLQRALDLSRKYQRERDELGALSALAGVDWHELNFKGAEAAYLEISERTKDSNDATDRRLYAVSRANLCFMNAFMTNWEASAQYGQEAVKISPHVQPVLGPANMSALGMATVMTGDRNKGLEMIASSVQSTAAWGMRRYNQLALDFALGAMFVCGATDWANCLYEAAAEQRRSMQHMRSPAEAQFLLKTTGITDQNFVPVKGNPLLGQTASALSTWTCDALQSLRTDA